MARLSFTSNENHNGGFGPVIQGRAYGAEVSDAGGSQSQLTLGLLGGFRLCRNTEVLVLSLVDQQLVAFLAVHNRPLQRSFVAGNLWIESREERASGNLRMPYVGCDTSTTD